MINEIGGRGGGDRLPPWIEIKGSCVFFSFFLITYIMKGDLSLWRVAQWRHLMLFFSFLFSSLAWWRWQTLLPPFSFSFLFFFFSSFDTDDAGLVNRLPFRQFGLDFETVFYSWFPLVFCISAILWPLALNRLFEAINPTWKVYWAAVPPIRPWPWNGLLDLVPPALLYLRYFMIDFEILNIFCSIFGLCGKKWKFCFINFEGQ